MLTTVETGTERKRPRWLEFLCSSDQLVGKYVHAHGRRVAEVMTPDVLTVTEGTSLEQIVHLMESRRIKRVPVLCGSDVVGIVSRANLLRALATPGATPAADSDGAIRNRVLAEFDKEAWAPHQCIDVTVGTGLWTCGGSMMSVLPRLQLRRGNLVL